MTTDLPNKPSVPLIGLLWDLLLIAITVFDLLWLMFDALYCTRAFAKIIDAQLPFYREIHHNFYYYDAFIIGIFLIDFIGRWVLSIYYQRYRKWFFYPFANWYDVVGCVPTSAFRILRLFRIIALLYKLHRRQFIDLNNWAIYRIAMHYYDVILEELSDRIVVKVLQQTQKEVTDGNQMSLQLRKEVLAPRKAQLAQLICAVFQEGVRQKYPPLRPQLEQQINDMIGDAIKKNESLRQLEKIPMVGKQLSKTIEEASSDIAFGVLDNIMMDLTEKDTSAVIQLIIESILEVIIEHQDHQEQQLLKAIISESIDLMIARINNKNWKESSE